MQLHCLPVFIQLVGLAGPALLCAYVAPHMSPMPVLGVVSEAVPAQPPSPGVTARRNMEEPLQRALSILKFTGSLHSSKCTQLLWSLPECCWSIYTWFEPFPNQTQQAQHGHLQSTDLKSRASQAL